MPKGGIRPRSSDGSLAHLLQPKWNLGRTRTIRVPKVLADQLLEIAHHLDSGGKIDLTQDNKAANHPNLDDVRQKLDKLDSLYTPLSNDSAQLLSNGGCPIYSVSTQDLTQDLQLDLEVERDRFLASLKVGRQAPEYKRTKALLDRFITFCRDTSQNRQA